MWEIIRGLLLSKEVWNAIGYLIMGAIVGAVISVKYSLSAQRPKLVISGHSGGGNQGRQTWGINISNRPSFFGQRLDGESARDVHAHIRLKEKKSQAYFINWRENSARNVTIEPGKQQTLNLFHWQEGSEGYFIVDEKGEPVARFQGRELKFILTLRDRLERKTELRLTVEFDDTHLKDKPKLRIIGPITLHERIELAQGALRELMSAFRMK